MSLYDFPLQEVVDKIKAKEISAKDLVDCAYKRIDEVEEKIDAYITLSEEEAYKQAELIDAKISRGEAVGDLAGIPVAIKDNICTKGIKTTCASKILGDFIPPYDAEVSSRMKDGGAIIIGKTNMDEFGMGNTTQNSYYKITKNPWNLKKVPGGSSGGSAAAVAGGEAFFGLGTDTGGSIRQPATLCGVVGLKPTYGSVSRYGLIAYGSSLEQAGPITKTVEDSALVLNHLYGNDPKDSTSLKLRERDFTKALREDVKGMKIGLPKEYFGDGIDKEVKDAIKASLNVFESLGAHIEETSLPYAEYALPAYYTIVVSEASLNLSRFDGIRYGYRADNCQTLDDIYIKSRSQGFGEEAKIRILLGTHLISSENYKLHYEKAAKVRRLVKEDFDKALSKYDLLITPAYPKAAFDIGGEWGDEQAMYASDLCTVSINVAGIPAMSIPCGFTDDGLPLGMQIIGKAFDEETIIRAGYTFEKNTRFSKIKPEIRGGEGNEV